MIGWKDFVRLTESGTPTVDQPLRRLEFLRLVRQWIVTLKKEFPPTERQDNSRAQMLSGGVICAGGSPGVGRFQVPSRIFWIVSCMTSPLPAW